MIKSLNKHKNQKEQYEKEKRIDMGCSNNYGGQRLDGV